MTEMIALLPMKEHSERVPNKNIRDLHGRPLFYYIADTLKNTGIFKLLAIDTDSPAIAQLATERYGDWVRIIDRPTELVGDHVSMNLILAHDISVLGAGNDYFQTHSTNPLLSAGTIRAAVDQYYAGSRNGEFDNLFSVNALRTRLYDKDLKPVNHNPAVLGRTQDLNVIYEENSNFYIFSGECFACNNHRIGRNPKPYVMSRNSVEGIDIDEISDWDIAEMILKSGYTNGDTNG
jgi:CMP-N-acetylneuraminic acid synthetase